MRVSARAVDDEHVEIQFQDTGSGIEPEYLDRVFDPFFTTKESGGTGLGLSIAHQIIARHEGTITVESEVDKGTIFTIVLPIEGPQEGTK
jgi:signal transduction histidine kinase